MSSRARLTVLVLSIVMACGLAVAVSAVGAVTNTGRMARPLRTRITGRVIPGTSNWRTIPAVTPASTRLPSKATQERVLDAADRYMVAEAKRSASFRSYSPGADDVIDYGLGKLWAKGIDGAGTTVAVIEGWDDPSIGKVVAGFDKAMHLPNPQIRTIFPDGKLPAKCPDGMQALGSYGSCLGWQGELELDVVAAHLAAPYAKIIISATPADRWMTEDTADQVAPPEMMRALEVISHRHLANVISISDGTGEVTYQYGQQEVTSQDPGELSAAAAGIPVTVGTGDCGVVQNLAVANGQCEDVSSGPDTAAWDDSPWVTAVGGSIPNIAANGTRRGPDPIWHEGVYAEGAGFSAIFRRPAYQSGVAHITHDPMRSVPDITMDASDGTSEATPLFAGILALATQANGGHDIGPVNPLLYDVLGPRGAAAGIADVVKGNNNSRVHGKLIEGFTAHKGFDVASGWGTIYAPRFVPALVAATRAAHQDGAVRGLAAQQLNALRHAIHISPDGAGGYYVEASGFIPAHNVSVNVAGKQVGTLTATSLGTVTYALRPHALGLTAGSHTVTFDSMLISVSGRFTVH